MKYLRYWRDQAGFTIENLAQMVGVSFNSVYRWERSEREPRAPDIVKLCEVLHVSEAELLNGPEELQWELKLKFGNKKGVMDLTATTSSAVLSGGDVAMGVELSAPFELWQDDNKFEELVQQLRLKRDAGLKARKEGWA